MSAFLMPRVALSNLAFEHLRLCESYTDWSRFPRTRGFVNWPGQSRLEQVFQVLLAENLRSLRALYHDCPRRQKEFYSGWYAIQPSLDYLKREIDLAELVRLCQCYEYPTNPRHYGL